MRQEGIAHDRGEMTDSIECIAAPVHVDGQIHYGIGISVLVCVLMARFLAWPTGLIVFAVVLAASLIFTHPDMTETEATRDAYFRAHKASIHPQRYVAFIQSLKEDAQPPKDDAPGAGE